jgi:hypothetical protein
MAEDFFTGAKRIVAAVMEKPAENASYPTEMRVFLLNYYF